MIEALTQVYVAFGQFSYLVIFVLGLILGSFLNSWMWRTRENFKIFVSSRSMCVHCHRQLFWWENVPVLSYIYLRGKCLKCKRPIPTRYPLVELCTAVLLVFIAWYHVRFLPQFELWRWLRDVFYITFLIVIFVYDALYQEILSRIVWPGVIIGFCINYFALGYSAGGMLLAAAVAGGFFLLQYIFSHGTWIGGGDVRLGVMMGVWLGWPAILWALFAAYIIGAIVSVFLLITKKAGPNTAVPFGTFLAIGTLCAIYQGQAVVGWYLGLLK
ncbi:MAG: hypothetical protein A2261_01170 [Candidatus Magasanikbacteria bacterium RIFOXYA2_FULL_44_8]|uniref:Prepilin peptidase n=1 Tax=Candidatus Magasanikbacteria bacterium RIFOXYA2_FULL_44_8 TaxID=1798696 RepID=A0A1F6NJV7_9BACT|nr:MAG: hypothetical protein A2261_01170 [Candidatus Magasanikbacteria bacterium RIFOXYA2_FULL_44_8]